MRVVNEEEEEKKKKYDIKKRLIFVPVIFPRFSFLPLWNTMHIFTEEIHLRARFYFLSSRFIYTEIIRR
jgi:hypothetical protein